MPDIRQPIAAHPRRSPHPALAQSAELDAGEEALEIRTCPSASALVAAALLAAVGLWSYWPVLLDLVATWSRVPDYSHGFLVIPAAAYLLWLRRDKYPGVTSGCVVWGSLLIAAVLTMRLFGAWYYFPFLHGWSIPLWITAAALLVGGARLTLWASPAIGFLFFMAPLPYSLEHALSNPLQRVATKLSCWGLQLLGEPAFQAGNVILLEQHRLEVAQACSGLRLFMSVLALAYLYIALMRRPWWEKLLVALATAPVAVLANAARIIATGLIYQYAASPAVHAWTHDVAGWAMIPLAAAMFGMLLWYVKRLIPEDEVMEMSDLVRTSDS